MSPEAEQRVKELENKVNELTKKIDELTDLRTANGAREFIDNDVVILRNVYAHKVYTKRSGTYVELTS